MVLNWLIKVVFYKSFFIISFLLYIRMSENTDLTCYQRNRDVMLNKAKEYYTNNKERLSEQARDKYRNLSEEKKIKKGNMRRIGIIIYLKKRNKDKKNIKKIIAIQKHLNISSVFC